MPKNTDLPNGSVDQFAWLVFTKLLVFRRMIIPVNHGPMGWKTLFMTLFMEHVGQTSLMNMLPSSNPKYSLAVDPIFQPFRTLKVSKGLVGLQQALQATSILHNSAAAPVQGRKSPSQRPRKGRDESPTSATTLSTRIDLQQDAQGSTTLSWRIYLLILDKT